MMDRVYGLKANKNSKDDISNKIKQLVSAICSKAVKPQMLVDINLCRHIKNVDNQGLDLKAFALLSKDKEMSALSIRSINLGIDFTIKGKTQLAWIVDALYWLNHFINFLKT